MYNIQLDKLCDRLDLGQVLVTSRLEGGFLNKMFDLKTTKGHYAVKALNPKIMSRKTAYQNHVNSEMIAHYASKHISALPALRFDEDFIIDLDGQYYLVFDFIEGQSISGSEISIDHCRMIGKELGKLHNIDFSSLNLVDLVEEKVQVIDWHHYWELSQTFEGKWKEVFDYNIENLMKWNHDALQADKALSEKVISHRDIDPKNVIWLEDLPVLIDWEAAGYVNPYRELLEVLKDWSTEKDQLNKDKFDVLLSAYKDVRGEFSVKWECVLDSGYAGMLAWLEYNLKRALMIECADDEEKHLGERQVISTLEALNKYSKKAEKFEKWLSMEDKFENK